MYICVFIYIYIHILPYIRNLGNWYDGHITQFDHNHCVYMFQIEFVYNRAMVITQSIEALRFIMKKKRTRERERNNQKIKNLSHFLTNKIVSSPTPALSFAQFFFIIIRNQKRSEPKEDKNKPQN